MGYGHGVDRKPRQGQLSNMTIDIKSLALPDSLKPQAIPAKPKVVVKPSIQGRFLKGPVPLAWLIKASCLPGKTLEVAIVLWFLSGVKKTTTIALPNKIMDEFGIDRHAKRRALLAMEQARLIAVSQKTGRSPVVTILDVQSDG